MNKVIYTMQECVPNRSDSGTEKKIPGITAVIPAFSDVTIVNNSVLSLITQWIPDESFDLEVIIVCDNPCRFDDYVSWYNSPEMTCICKNHISLKVISYGKNRGQGVARNYGIDNATYQWIVLCDEDDSYAPNAIYRFYEILNKEHNGEDKKPVSLIAAPIYSFDKDFYRNIITSSSIWVNSKLYNKEFLDKYELRFPTDENSHRSEDYPFSRMVDYASSHDEDYKRIDLEDNVDTFYWWRPNPESRSRCDEHYGSLLAGYTMRSSNRIFDFIKNFNNKYLTKDEQIRSEDEGLKQEILNMNIYSFYNFLWFLRDLATDWKDCKEEYWDILRNSVKELRYKLLTYWNEIVPSDVADMMYRVKHQSDCRFIESWIGSFENYVNNGCTLLDKNFNEIQDYCKTLEFDGANHEIHAPYVLAWKKRHEDKIPE